MLKSVKNRQFEKWPALPAGEAACAAAGASTDGSPAADAPPELSLHAPIAESKAFIVKKAAQEELQKHSILGRASLGL